MDPRSHCVVYNAYDFVMKMPNTRQIRKNQWRLSWNPWNFVWVPWPFIILPGKYCSHVKRISHKITYGFAVFVVYVVFVVVVIAGCSWLPGGWINIKVMLYQYRNSHCKDKSVSWSYVWKEGQFSYIERATGKKLLPQCLWSNHDWRK